jgi:hypothetical protein
MEPEGDKLSLASSYNTEGCRSFPLQDPPASNGGNNGSNHVNASETDADVPYVTGRTVPNRSLWISPPIAQPLLPERSLFLCESPSYDDDERVGNDDDSSLSSHSLPELRKSYAFVETMSTQDDDEEDDEEDELNGFVYESTLEEDNSSAFPVKMIHTVQWTDEHLENVQRKETNPFPKYSLLLGFLIGCFIQSSSLGANYVLTVLLGNDYERLHAHQNTIMIFSLVWSLGTSTMGVLVVLFIKSLLQVITMGLPKNCSSLENPLNMWAIEYSFAFGALGGVCIAWCGTDVLMGFHAHAFHSIITLLLAFLAKSFLGSLARNPYPVPSPLLEDEEELTDMIDMGISQPLLEQPVGRPTWRTFHPYFKLFGSLLGLLIGFFIQMSSLGASFLLEHLAGGMISLDTDRDGVLVFSLSWSVVFGAMGVAVLLVLRRLLMMVCLQLSPILASKLGLLLEFYFAVGSLVGINLAWVLTYLSLGLQSHILSSLVTLGGASLWCRILAYCFFSSRALGSDDEDDEDYIFSVESQPCKEDPDEAYEAVLLV